MARTVLKWPGGKGRLLHHLLPLITPCECYVEVFGGAASLLFAREPNGVEVYNDTSRELVNLFRIVKHHHCALVRELEFNINSRTDFNWMRGQPGVTDIQRAASFLFLNQLSFGGDGSSFGVQRKSGGGAATNLSNVLERVHELKARLAKVIVEEKDWRDCIKVYDSPGTFFFLDPPYVGGSQRAYKSWTLNQVSELLQALRGIRGSWLLTMNDSKATREIFQGCKVRAVERPRGIANKNAEQKKQYAELIVTPL